MGGDRALTAPMIVGAAVGVVVACAVLFALVGAIRGEDPSSPVIAGGESPSAEATESVGDAAPGEGDTPSDTATDAAPTGDEDTTATETEAASPAAEPSEQAPEDDGEAAEETPQEEAPEEEDPASQVDPGEISIQVLDAVGRDGGAAARATADELRSAGYNVVVINGASRSYSSTTVFWSEGQGPGGRAVAATLGASEARRTPAEVRLSDSVDVHVVVGSDRA